jgi:hypothetical protein
VDFEEFADAYGLAYDYDNLWITDTNNVVTGASYSGSVSSDALTVGNCATTYSCW